MGEQILKWWPIILGAIGYTVWQAKHESDLINVKKRVEELEKGSVARDTIIEQMALDVREMKTDIRWIKNNK